MHIQAPSVDSNTQTPIMYYSVQYSSTEDFIQHISLIVPVTTNMIIIPAGDLTCFLRVSANNSAGYGPFSDIHVPSTVTHISGNKAVITTESTVSSSEMVVLLSYQSFAIRYIVTIEQYNTGGSGRQQKVVSSNQTMLNTTFTSLNPFVPYTVEVVTVCCGGNEQISTIINFTKQGVPPAPENVRAYRLSSTSMLVSWDTIPLTVSRGFVHNYTIFYQSHDKQLHLDEVTVLGNQNNVLIANLIPMQQYVVSVAATTSAGQGDASNPTLKSVFSNCGSTVPSIVPSTTAAAVLACTTLVLGVIVTVLILILIKCHLKTQTLSAVNPISFTHSSTSRSNQETTVDGNFAMTQCSAYSTVNPSQPSLANSPPFDATVNNDSTYSNIKEMQMVDPPQE